MSKSGSQLMKLASKPAAAASSQTTASAEIRAANAFLYRAPHSSVHDASAKDDSDPIEAKIAKHDELPDHHPQEFRKPGASVRFFFKLSNIPELEGMLAFMVRTYCTHVNNKHGVEKWRTLMKTYLENFPLGNNKPKKTDTVYYDNANKMSAIIDKNNRLAEGDPPAPVPPEVLSQFAQSHVGLQERVYLSLRANYHRFMDRSCALIIDNAIKKHETDNELKGSDRIAVGKRYSLEQFKSDLTKLCCIATRGGYYFLPLYTTIREDNCPVQAWTTTILDVFRKLNHHDPNWAKLAENDAAHRAYAFLSVKEVAVLDAALADANRTTWNSVGRSTFGYFAKLGIAKAVEAINALAPDKFPATFVAKQHAPRAIESSLFTWGKVQDIVRQAILDATKQKDAQILKLQSDLTRARRDSNKSAKGAPTNTRQTARVNATTGDQDAKGTPTTIDRSKHPDVAKLSDQAWQRLCGPNRTGAHPCSQCLKLGMRQFHKTCDPVRRKTNYEKHKKRQSDPPSDRNNRPPKQFPPPESERKFPFDQYAPTACPECKREDVDPRYCNHPSRVCYRRKGGECDQKGAKSRRQRNDVVRDMAKQRKNGNGHKTGNLAVRVHSTADDVTDSPHNTHKPASSTAATAQTKSAMDPVTPTATPATTTLSAVRQPADTPSQPKTGIQYRTKRFPFHPMAQNTPFTQREMDFALDHHRTNKKKQIEHDYYKQGRELNFQALRNTVRNLVPNSQESWDNAHRSLTCALAELGHERTPAPTKRRRHHSPRRRYSESATEYSSDLSDSSYDSRSSDDRHHRRRKRNRSRHGSNTKHRRRSRDRNRRKKRKRSRSRDRSHDRQRHRSHSTTSRDTSRTDLSGRTSTSGSVTHNYQRRQSTGWQRQRRGYPQHNRMHARGNNGRSARGRHGRGRGRGNARGRAPPIRRAPQNKPQPAPKQPPPPQTQPSPVPSPPPTPPPTPPPSPSLTEAEPNKDPKPLEQTATAPPDTTDLQTLLEKKEHNKKRIAPAPGLIPTSVTVVDIPTGPDGRPASPTGVGAVKSVPAWRDPHQQPHPDDDTSDSQDPDEDSDNATSFRSYGNSMPVRPNTKHASTTRTRTPKYAPPSGSRTGHTSQSQQKKEKTGQSCDPQGPTKQRQKCQEQNEDYQSVNPLAALPGGQWLPAHSTVYNTAKLINKFTLHNNIISKTTLDATKLPNTSTSTDTLPSETKGLRLLQAIVTYRDAKGATQTGRVKLDTCSNGCYALPNISLPRPWRPWEPRMVKGIEGNLSPLGNPTYFTLYKHGEPVTIDTNDPPPGALPDGCVALLGLDAIHDLGINIAFAIKHNKHLAMRFIPDQEHLVEHRKVEAIKQYAEQGYVKDSIVKTCNLSERVVREYLEHHPSDYESKPIDKTSVDISDKLSEQTQKDLRNLCATYDTVFASNTNVLPPTLTGVKPHMFKLQEGKKPIPETRPSFPPAKARVINEWLQWAIDADLVEEATNTSYASRLILCPKYKASTPKTSLPDGIRVAWAGVRVNDTIEKTVPTYTDAWQQLYKVANSKYKFSADGLKQYWSIPLTEKAREMTAFWTPKGLFQFKRMVMGTKNAATVAQNAYTNALHTMLPPRSFPQIANFADDFLGGADSEEALVRDINSCTKHTGGTKKRGHSHHPTTPVIPGVPQEPPVTLHPFTHRDGVT